MASKRLFVAIDIPEPITQQLLELNPHLPGVRWLKPEQMHLTLSFLGQVGPIAEEALREKLNAVRFTAFFMPVSGLGAFPAKGKPHVIWTGVGTGHPQLFHVYKRVQEAALGAGLEPELRRWHPHITIARCRDVSPETIRPLLKENAELDLGLVRVESFSLYSSVPGPLGSAYTRELGVSAAWRRSP
ncbi:MAG: RNA 2',3'-cyclic phosphodiesterase [Chthoniobacterales bacterium]|nr:RNA 2',3'-cyclic phosphodiesterase [Chthoniobacterales bacterium]